MAWSTAHSICRGVGWNACFFGLLRGTEQVRSSSTGEASADTSPDAVAFAASAGLGEVAARRSLALPMTSPGAASSTIDFAVSRAFTVIRAGRAEKESFCEMRESLPSAHAVVSAAAPSLEIRASFGMPPGLWIELGSVPRFLASPVTYTAPSGVRARSKRVSEPCASWAARAFPSAVLRASVLTRETAA
ncbi:hypothetical protein [Streptomyces sp. NPDC020747]|uniref:hypothetical protein n=1 Tax=Streptomyces sp. NPDC020747 TaxID=3365086 RepID=UPI003798DEAB